MKKGFTFPNLLGLVLALAALSPATASAMPAPVNWTGFYLGGNVGGTWGDFTNDSGVAGPNGTGGDVSGGVQAGYNWQMGSFVVGGETDFSWLGLEANSGSIGSFEENWQVTVRGRAGYAYDDFLPYVTVGAAFTDTDSARTTGSTVNNTHTGLAYGAGLEYMCDRSSGWSARLEYLNIDVPKESMTVNSLPFAGGSENNTMRAAINYHF